MKDKKRLNFKRFGERKLFKILMIIYFFLWTFGLYFFNELCSVSHWTYHAPTSGLKKHTQKNADDERHPHKSKEGHGELLEIAPWMDHGKSEDAEHEHQKGIFKGSSGHKLR